VARRLRFAAPCILPAVCALLPALAQQQKPASSNPAGKEAAMGAALALETEQNEKMLHEPEICAYIQGLGETLAQHAGLGGPATVRVIDSAEIRGLAFPGGFLFISSGLIARTESEAELAGVIAHLIGHVAAGHRTHSMSSGQGSSGRDMVRVYFFGSSRSSCLRLMGESEAPAGWVVRFRAAERKADLLAINYLRQAHFDPLAVLEFFNKLRYDEPRLLDRISSDELIAMRASVEERLPPEPDYVVSSAAFTRTRERVAALLKPKVVRPPTLEREPAP